MNPNTPLRVWTTIWVVIFFATGLPFIFMEALPSSDFTKSVTPFSKHLFGLHLACWMIVGMVANYLWDLFKAGKSWSDISGRDLVIPMLISPIVFFGIWSMWPDQKPLFSMNLIAFQNGFFWQVVFSKAGPIAKVP
jgi:hypothetical protein